MSIEIHYSNRFNQRNNTPACNLFQAAAFDTWERIRFSRTRSRLKIHETTITQNLVYELNLIQTNQSISGLNIYESIDEKTNGDDLEICAEHKNGIIHKYALQAKIMYHNFTRNKVTRFDDGTYAQFKHMTGGITQIQRLLNYATPKGHLPLYLLYNYVTAGQVGTSPLCNITYGIEQYGCSLISAHHLQQHHSKNGNLKNNVRYSRLHPKTALPWFVIPCCFPTFTKDDVINLLGSPSDYKIRDYTIEQIEADEEWQLISGTESREKEKSTYWVLSSIQNCDYEKKSALIS